MDEFCSSVRDGTHDTPKPTSLGKYLVTSKAIRDNSIDFSCCYFISGKDYDKINIRSKVDQWDVLMTMIGSVGRLLLVKEKPNFAIKNIALFKIGDENKAKWFYYYLCNKPVQDYFEAIASGTSQHFIGLNHLRKLKIADYNDNSKKIVEILSAYDNLIENNNKRIKILEQMAENLYKEWFVRFRFPGHETTPIENGIPKGWEYKRADEVIDFNPTIKTGDQKNFTIIPMEALSTSSMVIDSNSFIIQDTISGRRSQNGDTLLAKITPCLENGKTGFVMGLPEGEVFGGSTEFIVMRSKTLTPHYVYCIARSQYFRQTAILSMNGADGRQRVDENKLKSTKILQPTQTLLNHFEKNVSPLFESISRLVKENTNLIKQRDLLLPRLMSGKIDV